MSGGSDARFPIGASLASGAYVIGERLFGERASGVYRGISHWDVDARSVLVTMTTRQTRPHAELMAELAMRFDWITPLRHIGEVSPRGAGGERYDGMVEDEPPGIPLSALTLPLEERVAGALLRQLVAVFDRAHAAGCAVGSLPRETVYVGERADGALRLTGIAPRAARFAAGAEPPDYELGPLYSGAYDAPEILALGGATAAGDVFSLCALAAHVISGAHPFEGDWANQQVSSILVGRRRPWTGRADWGALIDRGLAADFGSRIRLGELTRAIEKIQARG